MTTPVKPAISISHTLSQDILNFLEDHKIVEPAIVDLRGKTSVAEIMIVASGRSQKHISVAAELLKDYLKQKNLSIKIEGLHNSDWVLIDAGDVIIHLFKPETRLFYNLEKMWSEPLLPHVEGDR